MKEKDTEQQSIPSSCQMVLDMLAQAPAKREVRIPFDKVTNPDNTPENLLRSYIACQFGLEPSSILSTGQYSIFVSPEKAREHSEEAKVLRQYGKSSGNK